MTSYGYVAPTGFTIMGWLKRTALPPATTFDALFCQQSQVVQNWGSFAQENGRQLYLGYSANGFLHLTAYKEDGTKVLDWTSADVRPEANDNAWHFFALRLASDKKAFTLWIDGDIVSVDGSGAANATCSAALDWRPGNINFGGSLSLQVGNFGHDLWSGSLAWLSIVPSPLSNNRVAEHYAAGSGGTIYYGDDEVRRLERIFDWASIPETARAYDAPVTTLQGVNLGNAATDSANATAQAANGILFADGAGRLTYHNRRRRYNRWVLATLAESLTAAPNVALTWQTDDTQVYNDIRGSRPDGASVRIQDKGSQAVYDRVTYQIDVTLTSDVELRNYCQWVLGRYSTDRVRLSAITLSAESSDIISYVAETAQLGDVIVLDELPPQAPGRTLTYTIEQKGIDMSLADGHFTVTLQLTPNDVNYVFQVGTGTVGDGAYVAF